jgi:opacity protein-like surface antigen
MKKIISIASIAILFSQVSFAETTRTTYTSPITYTFKPLNVASPDPVAKTTTETTIPAQSKIENNIKEAAKVEASNSAKVETSEVAKAEPSNSESKTEGSYAGLDLFDTKTTLGIKNTFAPAICAQDCTYEAAKPALTNNSYGLGLTYKYAFNFNNFFIAPGIFFEQNNHQAVNGANGQLSRLQIKNRYGIRSDFGYDIGRFAPFLTIGYAEVSYRSRSDSEDKNYNIVSVVKNGINGNVFYGAGLKFNLTSSLSLNTEYNFQKIAPKTTLSPLSQDYLSKIAFRARMDTVKAGLYYKF